MITDDLEVVDILCKGCGVCAAVCPKQAITMRRDDLGLYTPNIDRERCVQCMLCVRVCPATIRVEDGVPGRVVDVNDDFLLGPSLESYVGYSLDADIRYDASSGGVVTSLLLSALENGEIDSALVVEFDEDNPFEAHAVIARDTQRIIDAKGSKYLPVEYSAALRRIIEDETIQRIGVVGLPCHLDGIRRASELIPRLRDKIAFTIGLFCKQTKNLHFTDLVLAKMGVEKGQVRKIKFRGDGWPGHIQVTSKNGETARYPFIDFGPLWGTFSCTPIHCLLCSSPLAEFADVSVGDPWGESRGDRKGTSLFLVRTKSGTKIIDQAIRDEGIHVEAVDQSKVVDAQSRFVVIAKKFNPESWLQVLKLFDYRIANLHIKQLHSKASADCLEKLWVFGMRYMVSSALFRCLFPSLPTLMLRMLSRGTIEVWKILSKFRKVN